jgi:DNA-binding Xre family transcriptional regulator
MTTANPHSQVKGADALLRRAAAALVAAHPTRLARIDAGKAIGVAGSVTCVMASGRPVGIDAWLAWCAALGLDPVTARRAATGVDASRSLGSAPPDSSRSLRSAPLGRSIPAYPGGAFLWWYFGLAVNLNRVSTHGWSIRDLGRRSHLSISTLSRLERGTPVSAAAVAQVCRTLDLHPHNFCAVPRETTTETRCDQREIAS